MASTKRQQNKKQNKRREDKNTKNIWSLRTVVKQKTYWHILKMNLKRKNKNEQRKKKEKKTKRKVGLE